MARFDVAVTYVLDNEGVDSDDENDHGKRTRFGITEAEAEASNLNIRLLTLGQARRIYRERYWNFDAVNSQSVATKLLDAVVNLGSEQGIKALQRAIEVAPVDGIFGGKTLAAVNKLDPNVVLERLSIELGDFYVNICLRDRTQLGFLKGWIRRAIRRPIGI